MSKKPPLSQMYDEVRMMRFKIRPLTGEITQLNFNNEQFIEMLWGLGKLDEFFQKHINDFNESQKLVFFRIFDELHKKFQNKFNKIQMAKSNTLQPDQSVFEMEIFKDRNNINN